jgi:hypothetical protein
MMKCSLFVHAFGSSFPFTNNEKTATKARNHMHIEIAGLYNHVAAKPGITNINTSVVAEKKPSRWHVLYCCPLIRSRIQRSVPCCQKQKPAGRAARRVALN